MDTKKETDERVHVIISLGEPKNLDELIERGKKGENEEQLLSELEFEVIIKEV